MIVPYEDVLGVLMKDGRICCHLCLPGLEAEEVEELAREITQEHIITREFLEEFEGVAFCDICSRRL